MRSGRERERERESLLAQILNNFIQIKAKALGHRTKGLHLQKVVRWFLDVDDNPPSDHNLIISLLAN